MGGRHNAGWGAWDIECMKRYLGIKNIISAHNCSKRGSLWPESRRMRLLHAIARWRLRRKGWSTEGSAPRFAPGAPHFDG